MSTNYVAGFMFNHALSQVALIRKTKPEWQRGKLNGVGGKVEAGENAAEAMVREFREETGVQTTVDDWRYFMLMHGNNDGGQGAFRVAFFVTIGDLWNLRTMEAEQIECVSLQEVGPLRTDMIDNLTWLIPLALDFLHDGRPGFVEAIYP